MWQDMENFMKLCLIMEKKKSILSAADEIDETLFTSTSLKMPLDLGCQT